MPQVMQDDGPVLVEFYLQGVEDRAASQKAGHYVAKDVEFIKITPAGGNLIWEGEVTDVHRQRYERQYDAWQKGLEPPEDGTPLKEWPPISPGQLQTMMAMHIRTVEALAQAPDTAMQRAGMGAMTLRDKARVYLQNAEDHGQVAEEIASLRLENETLKGRLEELEKALADLKPRRGRSPKDKAA